MGRPSVLVAPLALPHCIFQTRSLVSLDFQRFPLDSLNCDLPDDDPNFIFDLPNLKRLCLNIYDSRCGFVSRLVTSCPSLEELYLTVNETKDGGEIVNNNDALLAISNENLRVLPLIIHPEAKVSKVVIDAPKLHNCMFHATHLTCSFVTNPIALRGAAIFTLNQTLLRSLFPVILNVVALQTSPAAINWTEGLQDDQGNSLIFRSLSLLVLRLGSHTDQLSYFTFVSTSPSLLQFVKMIRIVVSTFKYWRNLNKFVEYLLSNAPILTRLAVVVDIRIQSQHGLGDQLEEMLFCKDLYHCSRRFPGCLIEFRGWHVSLPTNNAQLGTLEDRIEAFQIALGRRNNCLAD